MKVLLCERCFKGHRKVYMEWLAKTPGIEVFCYAPENAGVDSDHFFQCEESSDLKSLKTYLKWISGLNSVVKKQKIDIVHVLDADSIMRFFGLGFTNKKSVRYIFTYHHFFSGTLRKISYQFISGRRNRTSVVHTDNVKKSMESLGMKNVEVCKYPAFQFERINKIDVNHSKEQWHLPKNVPTIGIVGGMNGYKNILQFLKVMSKCQEDFHLLLCGKEGDVSETQLKEYTKDFREKVTMEIRRLDDDEYESAIAASDIVYCIYGLEFDGASGPLTDGVCANKMIIASDHKSLGQIVKENCLGYTADCTNETEIQKCVEQALKTVRGFSYNHKANEYRKDLTPEGFWGRYQKIYEKVKARS